jgi:predicted thioesterase
MEVDRLGVAQPADSCCGSIDAGQPKRRGFGYARLVQPGLVGELTSVVSATQLASALGSGAVEVFATPAMIALMEGAAVRAVQPALPPGATSVGTRVDVRHLAATPAGVEVRARAELVEVDGRRLVFRVECFDPHEKIGEGTHERAIVDPERLVARARAKAG